MPGRTVPAALILSPGQSPCCPRPISKGFQEYKGSPHHPSRHLAKHIMMFKEFCSLKAWPLSLHFSLQGNSFFVMTNYLKSEGQVQKLCPEVSRGPTPGGRRLRCILGPKKSLSVHPSLRLQPRGLCEHLLFPSPGTLCRSQTVWFWHVCDLFHISLRSLTNSGG